MFRDCEDGIRRTSINYQTQGVSVLHDSEDAVDDPHSRFESDHPQEVEAMDEFEVFRLRFTKGVGARPAPAGGGTKELSRR
jgi:hypothetical protein